jgi:hypothetical protein
MADIKVPITIVKIKRLAKGKRLHVRRLKQEARLAGTVYKPGIE